MKMPGMTPLGLKPHELLNLRRIEADQKIVAEREWQSRKLAPAPQQPCDVGLFSDDAKQLDQMEKCK